MTSRLQTTWNALNTLALLVVTILLGIGFGDLNTQSHEIHATVINQTQNRAKNVGVWCDAINETRDYSRTYQRATIKETQDEANVIEQALLKPETRGLTAQEVAFVRLYLNSVVALERDVPQVLRLHPYTLPDLPCHELEVKTIQSTRP